MSEPEPDPYALAREKHKPKNGPMTRGKTVLGKVFTLSNVIAFAVGATVNRFLFGSTQVRQPAWAWAVMYAAIVVLLACAVWVLWSTRQLSKSIKSFTQDRQEGSEQ